ncbi:acyl-CoA thioesterase/BAAT N-terminal domain-containing protein [Leifsonia poae]|uniref:acyl-CoA thioesterase/BAAT N-terminal domain-containing protein n=1 Tax=Leifsonia poae TaxID=110933 RepID=UPI001CBC179E|nr:acyl-CoA thioesterase/BAAT N-terminal domain-containing protein [Leifsonia poae]
MRRVVVAGLAVLAVVTALSGCAVGPGQEVGPRFALSQNPSAVGSRIGIRVLALPPGQFVTVSATVTAGDVWSSQAEYTVPPDGEVDLATEAPLDAPFRGADGMGLFWSLANAEGTPATSDETWGGATQTVDLAATVDGRVVARTAVQRIGYATMAPSRAVFDDGITGDYFRPTRGSVGVRPAVIVFDGTDSGVPAGVLEASQLAAMGYPALALSTFGSAGQSNPSQTFPAERFVSALDWLRSQPGVDAQHIFTFGSSRGAQLALWSAAQYAGDVYGAIAPGGTTGLICNSPVTSPSVTVDGVWVPCSTTTLDVSPEAVLPLSVIPGPIVLGCAGHDEQLGNGCAWMTAGEKARGQRSGDEFVDAPDATHLFYLPPYTPLDLPAEPYTQATESARVAFWAAVAAALSAPSTIPGR